MRREIEMIRNFIYTEGFDNMIDMERMDDVYPARVRDMHRKPDAMFEAFMDREVLQTRFFQLWMLRRLASQIMEDEGIRPLVDRIETGENVKDGDIVLMAMSNMFFKNRLPVAVAYLDVIIERYREWPVLFEAFERYFMMDSEEGGES